MAPVRTKDEILRAALAVSEYGLERLTYQTVAARVGCDPATVKNHFGGREELRAAGVNYHDLTMIFQDVPDQLYSDVCCHLNALGYLKIARVIGDALRGDAAPAGH